MRFSTVGSTSIMFSSMAEMTASSPRLMLVRPARKTRNTGKSPARRA